MESATFSSPHRYDHGLIGNCAYTALVDTKANISWLCWPRFDSSFIFGPLLDPEKGGQFSFTPSGKNFSSSQSYIKNTNILSTRIETTDGAFEVIDFAPRFNLFERYHKPLMLFRKIKKLSGRPRITVKCNPVGDYGKIQPRVMLGSNHIRYEGLEQPVRLTTNASLTYIVEEKEFTVTEDLYFVLSWGIPLEGPLQATFEDFYKRTKNYWTKWVENCHLPHIFQKEVIRSALALKLHQYEDTGGIIAACTTSLPEIHDEGRNWDYRFCWLRDTYYTLSALNSLGHFDEMEKYAHFVENLNPHDLASLQPVYCIDGSPEMTEIELELHGYMGNKPVRVGNQASMQIQHDAYGQILLAVFRLFIDERLVGRVDQSSVRLMKSILRYIEKTMETPDNGVWEFRGKQAIHSYTLMFHWAGSAAVRKVARLMNDEELAVRAEKAMNYASELLEKCYSQKKQAYAQALGSEELDASALQLITLGYFHDKPKEIALKHIEAIEKELMLSPGFLLRYKHADDFGHQKSAFLACSFWYVEALAQMGRAKEAQEILQSIIQTQNHVGLMSEDFDVETQSQWGNFPQTYSHVGLINCAFAIDKALTAPAFF
ncbi:glycoside hydrolase family 15 protein [Bdellovibrio bacteriovorus]|uniref:glycoside hydrolase family 15 protein n=1 Tax=Bdellovibrio bacteriovorus TaxID=959 RepID=UPI0035A60213